ncbi:MULTISPECIES: FCD domain-containing protein [unclassified Paraburkholderia]|uniref:FCD domain-containing protein n=1 Tax=unclassified Paraburkholderia TaxID=2615204 RepID=UPI00288949BB|nr:MULTISPECIES: FCD domain-containing protein [unclassified Paraburkholderia]
MRLAGQFHVLLTELAGGTELLGLVGQRVAKTELYKALFDPSKGSSCSADEHARIIDALDAGDLQATVTAMRERLSELEERVVEQVRKSAGGEDWGAGVWGLARRAATCVVTEAACRQIPIKTPRVLRRTTVEQALASIPNVREDVYFTRLGGEADVARSSRTRSRKVWRESVGPRAFAGYPHRLHKIAGTKGGAVTPAYLRRAACRGAPPPLERSSLWRKLIRPLVRS